jgi:ATP-binding cassette, subfamily B, multidrug efflux pump
MLKIYRNLKPFILSLIGILIFQALQVMANLYLPTLMADITNNGIMKSDVPYIWRTGGIMLAIAAGGVVCAVCASFLGSRTSIGLGRILRNKIFRRVEGFSLHEFDKFGASTLITRTTNDIVQIQTVTILIFNMMVAAPITLVAGTILAYSKDQSLTIILACALPVIIGVIAILATKGIPLFKMVQTKLDKVNLVLRENLTGIRVVRAFDRIDYEKDRFDEASSDLTNNYIKVNHIMAVMMPAIMLIMNLVTLSILWFGALKINDGTTNLGNLMAFLQYAMQILMSLLMLAMMFIMVPRAQAAAERITQVLETAPEISDPEDPRHANEEAGYVEFKNVTFSYHGAEEPAINNISFSAKPGETTAIIGGTGSGKSTIVNLIPRFYDAEGGEVLVDGVNVKEMSQQELRAKIGFVPQKAILFTGTIAENLKYGKDDATDEEVTHAADVAQATDFIESMKDSYDTMLSEGGLNLSGGQKQRLSIARSLVRKPEIYVFDDSFSALDFKTDANLRAALKKETSDATVIIVAQRVGTVMDADRIIVLEEGRVAGIGTHKELMSSCEIYREIVSSQLSEEELA